MGSRGVDLAGRVFPRHRRGDRRPAEGIGADGRCRTPVGSTVSIKEARYTNTIGDPNQPPDEIEFDEKGEKGKMGKVDDLQLSDEQAAELWMRRVQTTPAQFLKGKFARQLEAQVDKRGARP